MLATQLPLALVIALGIGGIGLPGVASAAEPVRGAEARPLQKSPSQAPPSPATPRPGNNADDEASDPFRLPDVGVKELIAFIKRLRVLPGGAEAGRVEFLKKGGPAMRAATDKIQEIATDEDKKLDGYDDASRYFLPKRGVKQLIAFFKQMQVFQADNDAERVEFLTYKVATMRAAGLKLYESATEEDRTLEGYKEVLGHWFYIRTVYPSEESRREVVRDWKACFATQAASEEAVWTAMYFGRSMARNDLPGAVELCHELGTILAKNPDKQTRLYADKLEYVARQVNMIGNPLEITGTTIDGSTIDGRAFNLLELRGKVVLVFFWNNRPAEIENIKANYERWHEQGFEIVGIRLDEEREPLTRFLAKADYPWITLYDGPLKVSPNRIWCEFSGLPRMILVDRAGNAVTVDLRGPALGKNLAALLGPPEPATDAGAAGKK